MPLTVDVTSVGLVSNLTAIEVVVFDLGGVLADVAGVSVMREWAGIDSDEELWRRWLECDWVRRFERGQCTPDAFARGVIADWELTVEPAEFIEAFASWVHEPYDGADELVDEVAGEHVVCALSNMNEIHWQRSVSTWPFVHRMDHLFMTFQVGKIKPDAEVFEHVIDTVGVAPEAILFLDDNQPNVDGARRSGLRAERVRGIDETRAVLDKALRL